MTPPESYISLESLRQDIDRIDDTIHDLLMERAAVVGQIGSLKNRNSSAIVHPAREMDILRRLAARHRSALPFSVIATIWREIMSAYSAFQTPLSVAVCLPATPAGPETVTPATLARNHFGALTPFIPANTPSQALRAVTEKQVALAVLPGIREEGDDPWWRLIATHDPSAPKIIARLPVIASGPGETDAFVVASQYPSPETLEHSYIALELPPDTSRTRLRAAFASAGLDCGGISLSADQDMPMALVALAGPISIDDPRLLQVSAGLAEPVTRLYHLGGHPDPLVVNRQGQG